MSAPSPLNAALILWGIVTGILAVLLIYRSLISMKADNQLFLDAAESNLEQQQQQAQHQLDRLTPYAKVLGATSGLLLVAVAGMWLYEQFAKSGVLPQ